MSSIAQLAVQRPRRGHLVAAATALAVAATLTAGAGTGHAATSSVAKIPGGAAGAYCQAHGGSVQFRSPAYGTNAQAPIQLSGRVGFCRFVNPKDQSRVYVSLNTMTATRPTLAALAYLEHPAMANGSPNANPASVYCSQLGGTDSFGGINAAGGGWVNRADRTNPVLEACAFPDGSMIDSWALAYRANGVIRGADLSKILRYHPAPSSLPAVFAS